MSFQHLSQFLSVFCCSIFTGAAIYINVAEHPARMECGTVLAATVFPPSYKKAAMMQASLALLGFLFSVIAFSYGSSIWWLIGGIILFSVVPFTLICIMPTNKILLSSKITKDLTLAQKLLVKWGKLHAVRSFLSSISLLIFLNQLVYTN